MTFHDVYTDIQSTHRIAESIPGPRNSRQRTNVGMSSQHPGKMEVPKNATRTRKPKSRGDGGGMTWTGKDQEGSEVRRRERIKID